MRPLASQIAKSSGEGPRPSRGSDTRLNCSRRRIRQPKFHDLRHTCASLCIALGAHPKAIQERLGHSSITVTLDRYGHLFPKLDEALTARLDDLARAAAGRPPVPNEGASARWIPPRAAESRGVFAE